MTAGELEPTGDAKFDGRPLRPSRWLHDCTTQQSRRQEQFSGTRGGAKRRLCGLSWELPWEAVGHHASWPA